MSPIEISELEASSPRRFYGKYRGIVYNNLDPMQLGRLQVYVPAVYGDSTMNWALPCVPFAGPGVGFFMLPPVGANVWAEFEGGDPDFPIWSGCFWGDGEVPVTPAVEQTKVLRTDGITLTLSDVPGAGGFTLEVNPPAVAVPIRLVCDSSGLELTTGSSSVKLNRVSVSVNDGALEVI
jgi:hypothetical protein